MRWFPEAEIVLEMLKITTKVSSERGKACRGGEKDATRDADDEGEETTILWIWRIQSMGGQVDLGENKER